MKLNILGLKIENSNYNDILAEIERKISCSERFSITYVNAYVLLSSNNNSDLKDSMNQLSALYADGIGVYWASRFLYGRNGISQRINGTDLYYKILELAQSRNYGVYFFGGGDEAVALLEESLSKRFPNLIIKGITGRDLSFDENFLEKLNHSHSDILLLGLGTPYQEKWLAILGKKCNIPIQISVGSGIDFLSGVYQRAPKLFRSVGLEWLYRLILEPKRLWKRYLIGIPVFIFLIVKQKFIKNN